MHHPLVTWHCFQCFTLSLGFLQFAIFSDNYFETHTLPCISFKWHKPPTNNQRYFKQCQEYLGSRRSHQTHNKLTNFLDLGYIQKWPISTNLYLLLLFLLQLLLFVQTVLSSVGSRHRFTFFYCPLSPNDLHITHLHHIGTSWKLRALPNL